MTNIQNKHFRLPLVAAVAVLGVFFGLVTLVPAAYSDDPASWDSECMDCHEDMAESLMGTAHTIGAGKAGVSCSGCHEGAKAHLEDEDNLPYIPDSRDATRSVQVCVSCHPRFHAANLLERDPHADGNRACDTCHKIHGNGNVKLLRKEEPKLCYECHADVEVAFYQPYRHPVNDRVMKCTDCHASLFQSPKQATWGGKNAPCWSCHGRFQGPFPFDHQAAVDYSTEEGGCLTCHAPHGSAQPRMLNQPYEAPDFALCSQCHVVPKHQNNIQHGSSWAGVPCNECHVDIHGSYENRKFLRASLQSEGCFNVGCHKY